MCPLNQVFTCPNGQDIRATKISYSRSMVTLEDGT